MVQGFGTTIAYSDRLQKVHFGNHLVLLCAKSTEDQPTSTTMMLPKCSKTDTTLGKIIETFRMRAPNERPHFLHWSTSLSSTHFGRNLGFGGCFTVGDGPLLLFGRKLAGTQVNYVSAIGYHRFPSPSRIAGAIVKQKKS